MSIGAIVAIVITVVLVGLLLFALLNRNHLSAEPFATGFDAAVGMVQRSQRYYYVWEQTGRVWRLDAQTGERHVVLDKRRTILEEIGVKHRGDERGVVGLAFHPSRSNEVYISYSVPAPTNGKEDAVNHVARLSRFTVRDLDGANERFDSERVILDIPQPREYHHAQTIRFGPRDGLLYYSTGDGGPQKDPRGSAQNLFDLKGKMLRIDVDHEGDHGKSYAIPPHNPYASSRNKGAPEIIALGLRNPWLFSFDNSGERLFIGDVGNEDYESVKVLELDAIAPEQPVNFGWAVYEAEKRTGFENNQRLSVEPLTNPAFAYETGGPIGRAIMGGFTLGTDDDRYFFADYVTGKLVVLVRGSDGKWSVKREASIDQWFPNDDDQQVPSLPGQPPVSQQLLDGKKNVPALARDLAGNIYALVWTQGPLVDSGGLSAIYRLTV